MNTTIEHLGISSGLSPWCVQLSMLPVRRANPDDVRSPDPIKRQNALDVAARRAEKAYARIAEILRTGPKGGMTADQIASPKQAGGGLYRHLSAMADKGLVEKRKISKNIVKWRLVP